MDAKNTGSFEGWDNAWEGYANDGSGKGLVFTKQSAPESFHQFYQFHYAKDLLELIKGRNYQSFLELGSGRGTTCMYLAQAGYSDITMVDLAEHAFVLARQNFAKENLPLPTMLIGNVEDTGLEGDKYDCIYNIGLLEHFENPAPTLAEAYRLLRADGMIFMPIVPDLPYSKSVIQRLFLNPWSLAKQIVKTLIGYKSTVSDNDILRTTTDKAAYAKICKDIGYKNVMCIAYNPYWKIYDDESWWQNNFLLPIYQKHLELTKKANQPSLQTSDTFELCYLLVAFK
jgi:2-polyprenyl-3-methyl-5-hydroxy-6-metoxy-1,4-benzoquinol methylase